MRGTHEIRPKNESHVHGHQPSSTPGIIPAINSDNGCRQQTAGQSQEAAARARYWARQRDETAFQKGSNQKDENLLPWCPSFPSGQPAKNPCRHLQGLRPRSKGAHFSPRRLVGVLGFWQNPSSDRSGSLEFGVTASARSSWSVSLCWGFGTPAAIPATVWCLDPG